MKTPRTKTLTLRKYAEHRERLGLPGQTYEAVRKAAEDGRIKVLNRKGGMRVDWAAADKAWSGQTQRRSDQHADDVTADDLNLHKARKEKELADKAAIANAERRGELVERAVVESAWFALARATRDRLLGVPDKLAGQLAAEDDEHACRVMLEREIRDALREVSEADAPGLQ